MSIDSRNNKKDHKDLEGGARLLDRSNHIMEIKEGICHHKDLIKDMMTDREDRQEECIKMDRGEDMKMDHREILAKVHRHLEK